MEKKFFCIHGHFYQPPRENPWTGELEKEESAYPFHDWNERITVESYRPNSAARILDAQGNIRKTLNNYSRISFDFGSTLLSWIQKKASDVYQAILSADAESFARFSGHGNALAQTYHHLILPLASRRDKETQVIWGVRDFEFRFGRRPEGMWLPETAVDVETLEILAEQGIRFTLLAPRQAKRFRKVGEGGWKGVGKEGIDPMRPYRAVLPSGKSLSIFFFHGPISQAVAFEGLLHSGDHLLKRLKDAFPKDNEEALLVHVATDGETFGHHHRFGEMALAYALDKIESENFGSLTNYGEFLEKNPPVYELEIRENTSWSCVHGIERWRFDCGCHVGGGPGWTQAWRAPLREALDHLRVQADSLFERSIGHYLRDPWSARNDSIELLLNPSGESERSFSDRHAKGTLSEREKRSVFQLLEMERQGMMMQTSCGWFFDDISGLESLLVLKNAGRLIDLVREAAGVDLEPQFLKNLEKAQSNDPKAGNARLIYEKKVKSLPSD